MSWLYMPEWAEEFLGLSGSSAGIPSAMSSENLTPSKSSKRGSRTDGSTTLPYGTMPAPSMVSPGEDTLMSSAQDSPANHSVSPETERGMLTIETDGLTPFALLEKSSPDFVFWRTCRVYLVPPTGTETGTSEPYSESWPKAGMMQDGACYQRPSWEHRISEIGYGLWPTPRSSDVEGGATEAKNDGTGWYRENRKGVRFGVKLRDAVYTTEVLWPTPNTLDHLPPKSEEALAREATVARPGRKSPANLRDAVSNMHNWPTPRASDWRSGLVSEKTLLKNSRPLNEMVASKEDGHGGLLNPDWEEWLMGWPIGWTALKPLATDRFLSWLQQLGSF